MIMLNDMMSAFIEIAQDLNKALVIQSLLYGSLGLSRLLGEDLQPEDIDVLLPESYLRERFSALSDIMKAHGYTLIDLHEHTFERGGLKMSFAVNDLKEYAGIETTDIPVISESNAVYLLPTLSQYLVIYRTSLKDSYRRDKNNEKDEVKIKIIVERLKLMEKMQIIFRSLFLVAGGSNLN